MYLAAIQPTSLCNQAEFRHPLVGWRNAVEEPALGRSREAGFSTSQNCPRADNLAALEMTEEVFVSLYCAIFSSNQTALANQRPTAVFLTSRSGTHPAQRTFCDSPARCFRRSPYVCNPLAEAS